MSLTPELALTLTEVQTLSNRRYQRLDVQILSADRKIQPEALQNLELPAELDYSQGVILNGAGPLWLYSCLIERCRQAALPWVGAYDQQMGVAVVIASNSPEVNIGDKFRLVPKATLCPAILIGGPPNSGKGGLSDALYRELRMALKGKVVQLYPANWDGEGKWYRETADRLVADNLRQRNKAQLKQLGEAERAGVVEQLLSRYATAVAHIREVVDLLLVDVGGKPDQHELVEQCTHYIVISKDPDEIQLWHDLCAPQLQPIAVIHSVRSAHLEVLKTDPYLEIVAGPWERDAVNVIPKVLLEAVVAVDGERM